MAKKAAKKVTKRSKTKATKSKARPDGIVEINCTRTSQACKCHGKSGYIYDCPNLGKVCLPMSDKMVTVTPGARRGPCNSKDCDDTSGVEYNMLVNGRKIIGSTRHRAGSGPGSAAQIPNSPVVVECIDTGVACRRNGKAGTYWKCGERLVCLLKNERMISKLDFGPTIKIDATEVRVTYVNKNGSTSTELTHALCDCECDESLHVAIPRGPRISCVPTTTKCKCNGKSGYVYNCGSEGYRCIPTTDEPPRKMSIVWLQDLAKKCSRPECDSSGNTQSWYWVDNSRVEVGSKRPNPASPARGSAKAKSTTKSRHRKS